MGEHGLLLSVLAYRQDAGSCKHGNEHVGYVFHNMRAIFDWVMSVSFQGRIFFRGDTQLANRHSF
jgi:hypothetical protein